MNKKSIILIHSLYFPHVVGGAEISTQILAEVLSSVFDVYVITLGPQLTGTKWEEIKGVNVIRIPSSNIYWMGKIQNHSNIQKIIWHSIDMYNIFHKNKLTKIIKEINPLLIHTQNLMGISTIVWDIAFKLNIPIVHTLRDYYLINPLNSGIYNKVHRKLSFQLSQRVAGVIGISSFMLKKHVETGFFKNSEKVVISNVVTGDTINKTRIKILGDKSLKIGYFGQIESIKGVNELLMAISELNSGVVKEVLVCGDGSQKNILEQKFNNDKRIKFLGKLSQSETKKIMSEVDLTAVPSIWEEPFGRVIIESFQVGTPVVGSYKGGIPELIENKNFLFNPLDKNSIKASITSFYESEDNERINISNECVEKSKNFNEDMLLRQHMSLYERLTHGTFKN